MGKYYGSIVYLCRSVGAPPSKFVAFVRQSNGTRADSKIFLTAEDLENNGTDSNSKAAREIENPPSLDVRLPGEEVFKDGRFVRAAKLEKKEPRVVFRSGAVVQADLKPCKV